MALVLIGPDRKIIEKDLVKFSDNPLYYGFGFKVGTDEWKLLKENDFLFLDEKKFKINQHVDVGDYTWFLFTNK